MNCNCNSPIDRGPMSVDLTRDHEVHLLALSSCCRVRRAGQDRDPCYFQLQNICNPPTEVVSRQK